VRDDLKKLPLPPEAKSYARRKGLSAMKKQPQSYINMVAAVTNQRSKKHGFKNVDAAGKVPHAIKEQAGIIIALLLENEEVSEFPEFKIYRTTTEEDRAWEQKFGIKPSEVTYNIEVPGEPIGRFVNKIWLPKPLDQEGIRAVEKRLSVLVQHRGHQFPPVGFFSAPWGYYLIHNGNVSRIS
jgi:hypothetical protein